MDYNPDNIDLYSLFNVDKSADPKTIKQKYNRMLKKLHYDKNISKGLSKDQMEENEEQIRILTWAYSILSDPEKRLNYDQGFSKGYGQLLNDFIKEKEEIFSNSYYGIDKETAKNMPNEKFLELFEKNRVDDPSDHGYKVERMGVSDEYISADKFFEQVCGETKELGLDTHAPDEPDAENGSKSNGFTKINEHDGLIILDGVQNYNTNNYMDYAQAFTTGITPDFKGEIKTGNVTDSEMQAALASRGLSIAPGQTSWKQGDAELKKRKISNMEKEREANKSIVDRFKTQYISHRIENEKK